MLCCYNGNLFVAVSDDQGDDTIESGVEYVEEEYEYFCHNNVWHGHYHFCYWGCNSCYNGIVFAGKHQHASCCE